ncbi:hypothetical protein THAOC_16019 [Thalassiosira oceanica]|uniref:Uncharacterized protein n=1 Tax=Thalassiosira oceanica TaxID=159749 RepID=K0SB35_THAOC|nr:hypothetical protein THAOC_16019 [Thalassiosira oceanica]|eukprot:EJK63328.1 hypothetical protein THAOC_16019 [Thalassiosira oceanica]
MSHHHRVTSCHRQAGSGGMRAPRPRRAPAPKRSRRTESESYVVTARTICWGSLVGYWQDRQGGPKYRIASPKVQQLPCPPICSPTALFFSDKRLGINAERGVRVRAGFHIAHHPGRHFGRFPPELTSLAVVGVHLAS